MEGVYTRVVLYTYSTEGVKFFSIGKINLFFFYSSRNEKYCQCAKILDSEYLVFKGNTNLFCLENAYNLTHEI